ncbi:hypothetical protein [Metabacillus litoralis]|uniref:hypothetical protein n=1 Tax=Metabacillus litoralis TaxID=152268 RepID=UPI001CFCF8B9|nr:hypothetical protein [Metabacillus litoralis]
MVFDDLFDVARGRSFMGLYNDASGSKIAQDRYDVYVNEDFIGQKFLLTAQESVQDIDDFLKNEGINQFESFVDGDHYYIKAGENKHKVEDVLKVYLQNR